MLVCPTAQSFRGSGYECPAPVDYRRTPGPDVLALQEHFLLFVGIMALPHLFSLAIGLANVPLRSVLGFTGVGGNFEWTMVALAVAFTVGAIAQAATVVAVSELHLGRHAGVIDSYSRVKDSLVSVHGLPMACFCHLGLVFCAQYFR